MREIFVAVPVHLRKSTCREMDPSYARVFFSSAEMEMLFQRTFGPQLAQLGFVFLSKSRWIRSTHLEFKHLFYLYPFRPGADYAPWGALSFDYVPRLERGKVRISPAPKHTRVHFCMPRWPGNWDDHYIPRARNTAEQKAVTVAKRDIPHIDAWLTQFKSLADVAAAMEHEKKRSMNSFSCYPETALSYAFTLAKLGATGQARQELSIVLSSPYFGAEVHKALRDALEKVLRT